MNHHLQMRKKKSSNLLWRFLYKIWKTMRTQTQEDYIKIVCMLVCYWNIIWNQVYVSSYGDGMTMVMPLCLVRVWDRFSLFRSSFSAFLNNRFQSHANGYAFSILFIVDLIPAFFMMMMIKALFFTFLFLSAFPILTPIKVSIFYRWQLLGINGKLVVTLACVFFF